MKILYFCPLWGNTLPFKKFCQKVKKVGYDGVEMDLPLDKYKRGEILQILKDNELLLIGQYWQSLEKDFRSNQKSYKKYLQLLVGAEPLLINAQTGKDYFSLEMNMNLVNLAKQISSDSGIDILHETHRGKFLFSLPVFAQAVREDPTLKITFDVSHWCTVHESLLDDQYTDLKKAIKAAGHIHSRIGFDQGPQINDPRAPEWKLILDKYFSWWDQIVKKHHSDGRNLTVTAEFGPSPYMPQLPYSRKPVSNQWDVNLHMLKLFKKRYSTKKISLL